MLLYLILVIFGLFVYIALSDWFSREARLIRKIPGPKAWPVVGNVTNLVRNFKFEWDTGKRPSVLDLTKDYGHLYQFHVMSLRAVFISSPEDSEIILSSPQHMTKPYFYHFTASWLGNGLPLSTGTKWQQRRKMLTKAFHFATLKKFVATFNEETEELLKRAEEETANEQTNLFDFVRPSTLRIICESVMGMSLRENKDAYNKYFNSLLTLCESVVVRLFKVWLYNDFIFNLSDIGKRHKSALQHFHGLTNKVINDKRELVNKINVSSTDHNSVSYDENKKPSLLDLLLENEKSGLIDFEGVQEEVNSFIFAGFDTTTTVLSFFLMAIANESAVQDKIYEEQQRIFGNSLRSSTIEDLNEMKYLECCIKESSRLYPSGPRLARQLTQDTVLSGYTVPAGTSAHIYVFEMQRRADLYPDPERFDPDRFLPENCRDRHPYSFLPFSAGLRNCIGQKFAMLELKTLLSGLLRKFHVEPVTRPSDLIFVMDIVLATKHPRYARFRLRNY